MCLVCSSGLALQSSMVRFLNFGGSKIGGFQSLRWVGAKGCTFSGEPKLGEFLLQPPVQRRQSLSKNVAPRVTAPKVAFFSEPPCVLAPNFWSAQEQVKSSHDSESLALGPFLGRSWGGLGMLLAALVALLAALQFQASGSSGRIRRIQAPEAQNARDWCQRAFPRGGEG